MLNEHKHQLQIYLEERVQESDSLTSKIQDLETQLCKEKEECKRISSKIRKFIKEHNRHSKIQDELKRSQDRLQKLADQLGTEAARSGANGEDTSINIVSDEETIRVHVKSPRTESLRNASPSRKRLRIHMVEAHEESKREGLITGAIRREKFSRWDTHLAQANNAKEFEVEAKENNGYSHLANEDKSRRGKGSVTNIASAVKMKDSEWGLVLPTTGMAAHAVDEVVEVVELDEKIERNASSIVDKGVAHDIPGVPFPLPPPPPLPRNAYSQYKGKNEDVDVDGLDDEMVDVEII